MDRGQVSVETLFAVFVLLGMFIVVIAQVIIINDSNNSMKTMLKNKNDCLLLGFALSQVYASGNGATLAFDYDSNARIYASQKTITVGSEFCTFIAKTIDANIVPGSLTLTNSAWNVSIS